MGIDKDFLIVNNQFVSWRNGDSEKTIRLDSIVAIDFCPDKYPVVLIYVSGIYQRIFEMNGIIAVRFMDWWKMNMLKQTDSEYKVIW